MTSNPPSADDIRQQVGCDWNDAADGWTTRETNIHSFLWPVSVRMAVASRLGPGMRVLDVGTGTGDLAIYTAYHVESSGSVLGIDLSEKMLQTARDRAAALGLKHVRFEQASGDTHRAEPQSFDAVVGRFSAFFFPDVVAGLGHLQTLLKPGGRACFSIWTPPDVNPAFGIPRAAMAPYTDGQQDPNAPGPFRLSGNGQFAAAMKEASYTEITDEEVNLYQFAPSREAYWQMLSEVSGSFRKQYSQLSHEDQQAVKSDVIKRLGEHETNGVVRVPARARIVAGI